MNKNITVSLVAIGILLLGGFFFMQKKNDTTVVITDPRLTDEPIVIDVSDPNAKDSISEDTKSKFESTIMREYATLPDEKLEDSSGIVADVIRESELVANGEYLAKGDVQVRTNETGNFVTFNNFLVTNGPDLRIGLTATAEPSNVGSLGDFIDLGLLGGNAGSTTITLPEGTDINMYKNVVVYIEPFDRVIAIASVQ